MWTLALGHHEDRSLTHGYEPTREAAMAAFAKSWRRELVLRSGSPLSGTNRKTFGPSEPYRFCRSFGSIYSTSLSALVTDRAMETWYHLYMA
jgi:hypothetical protein